MRVALTGGASGIGAAVARKLTDAGHEVTAFDIAAPDHVARWIKTDLSDPAAIDAAVADVDGHFDALINNAGLPPRPGNAERVLRLNYFGLKTFLDGMIDKLAPGASIVNVASRAGAQWRENLDEIRALMRLEIDALPDFIAARNMGATRAYNLTKEAVIVLTLSQVEPLITRGLRMNAVSPAAVSTAILDDFTAAFGDRVSKNLARVGRAGNPDEIADAIIFLAGPESRWIKGIDLPVDGGTSALAMTDALDLKTLTE